MLSQGRVKCWGASDLGQIGLGDADDHGDAPGDMGNALSALDMGNGRTALVLAGGHEHSCAILDDVNVKCWGRNDHGQLGIGDTGARGNSPGEMGDALPVTSLGNGATVVTLAAGGDHTCALLSNGSIKCWGYNASGQLGLGDNTSRGDAPGEMGDALPAVDLGNGQAVLDLAAGGSHTCALLNNGSIKCWGSSYYGQRGLGDTASRGDNPGEMGDALPTVKLFSPLW